MPYKREFLAQIDAAHIAVADDLGRRAFLQHPAVMQDIGAVDDIQRVAHIVVGDQDADAAILEMPDQVADFAHRDGIDAGERLVQQDVGRMGGQAAGDFHPAALAARQRDDGRVADMGDAEFGQQGFDHRFQPRAIGLQQFGGGADILFGGEAAEDRGFLRQIADAQARAAVHGQPVTSWPSTSIVPVSAGIRPVIM